MNSFFQKSASVVGTGMKASSSSEQLVVASDYKVQKIKICGSVPGYDNEWQRNVQISFLKAHAGCQEFKVWEWWIRLCTNNENRYVQIPFKPKVCHETDNQIQFLTEDCKDPTTEVRLSSIKICDSDKALLEEIRQFVRGYITEGASIKNLIKQRSCRSDDKENAGRSSSCEINSTRPLIKDAITMSASTPVAHRTITGTTFYGSSPKLATITSGVSKTGIWKYKDNSKPTSSMQSLRDAHRPVGTADRPIPSIVRTNDGKTLSNGGTKSPASRKFNLSGRFNPVLGCNNLRNESLGTRRTPAQLKAAEDQYEFRDESIENELDFNLTPTRSSLTRTPSPTTSLTAVVSRNGASSPVGMLNLGNSCYMNAVLQALFAHPTFNYDLSRIDEHHFVEMQIDRLQENARQLGDAVGSPVQTVNAKDAEKTSLILCLLNLLRSCDASQSLVNDEPQKQRLQAVKQASKKFIDSQQHDAQEFLCCLLDDLKEEHREDFFGKDKVDDISDAGSKETEKVANPVEANFDFVLRKSLTCRSCCKIASESLESFNNLSVHIPDAEASSVALQSTKRSTRKSSSTSSLDRQNDELSAPLEDAHNTRGSPSKDDSSLDDIDLTPHEQSLQHCIDHFFEKEEIEYRPEQCGHEDGGVISYCLDSLPRIFVVHLKRFMYTMTSNNGTKCSVPVSVPAELDLSKYCAPSNVKLPKLIDSPVAPKSALKTEIMSPIKLPLSPTVKLGNTAKCRKRLICNDSESDEKLSENDENSPISIATKRLRSTSKAIENLPTRINAKGEDGINRYSKYRLSAVISHTGTSSDYGHYTTDAYHSTLKKWFRFDDLNVKGISEAAVLSENKWNGYIFFYTALPIWEQTIRTEEGKNS